MLIAAVIALVVWSLQLALVLRVRHAVPALSAAATTSTPERWPRLSMVVPARDEAAHVESAVASKLACGYPELEVVAVNDRSRDETGAIFDRIAATDARVAVVHVSALPDGWLGKLHAMARGLERATGEWVLFSDADVHVEPAVLGRVIAWAEAEKVDLIAVFPRMDPVSPLLDAGLAGLLRVLAISGRTWAANDDRSHVGMGVGAFNLVRRSALDVTDAISFLRMEVADDVALGSLLKQSGKRCRFFAGRDDVHLVFMDSLAAMGRSADKGGGMLGFSWWRTALIALGPITLELGLPLWAIASGGAAARVGCAALLVATATHALVCSHFGFALRGPLLWPVGQMMASAFTLRAGLRAWRRQGITWRDTFYAREVLAAGQRLQVPSLRVTLPKPPEGAGDARDPRT